MNRSSQGNQADPPDVSFYVPCLNERDNVRPTLDLLASVVSECELRAEVLVFDDGSTDGTSQVVELALQEFADRKEWFDLQLLRNEKPRGLGTNFFVGAARGRGTHFMLVNGDHSETYETLLEILSSLGKADLVISVFDGGDQRGPLRRGISRLFTSLVNLLNGHSLRYYNGPTLHRRTDVIEFGTGCYGFGYQAELLTRELDAGRSYLEVSMVNRDRQAGATKAFKMRNLSSVASSLWRIWRRSF